MQTKWTSETHDKKLDKGPSIKDVSTRGGGVGQKQTHADANKFWDADVCGEGVVSDFEHAGRGGEAQKRADYCRHPLWMAPNREE